MPSDRTTVTELGTGLGMIGQPDLETALRSRAPVMRSLAPETWDRLELLHAGGAYDAEFHAAWANGRAFLVADDGLRGRLPLSVEWKGTGRAPGDEVAPIDLRVDHVYLVSCKYLSNILFNVAPASVFDSLLLAGHARNTRSARDAVPGSGDWYAEVAPSEYQALYECVRAAALAPADATHAGPLARTADPGRVASAATAGAMMLPGMETAGATTAHPETVPAVPAEEPRPLLCDLPRRAVDVTSAQREALSRWLRRGWPPGAKDRYVTLSDAVARVSARRWEAALGAGSTGATGTGAAGAAGAAMLWRLLRIGSAPYFVLGSSHARSLRLRIATSWDWRQQYRLASFALEPQSGGQPRVRWEASVRDRTSNDVHVVAGHIEVRWSHGRFGGLPEAKGYLDTPHHHVPGYYELR